jgi:hypothetical protein
MDSTLQQVRDDQARAQAEYQFACARYERVRNFYYEYELALQKLDPSLYLAWLECDTARQIVDRVTHVVCHYSQLCESAASDAPLNITGITPQPTQIPHVPGTPVRIPRTPVRTPRTPMRTPRTPVHVVSPLNSQELSSPFPNQKHYSVVRGRRTGVYSGWYENTGTFNCVIKTQFLNRNHAKPLVEGLGEQASYQSFSSFAAAINDYLVACEKGYVKAVRLPTDSEAEFGDVNFAEDL